MPSDHEDRSGDEDEPRRRRRDHDDEYDDRPRRRRDADDEYDEPPRRRREPSIEATDFLIPTNVSGYSIASCYLGLISCIPLIGLLFAIIALVCGIIALRRRKKTGSYGAVTSDARAVIGIVLSSISLIGNLGLLALVILMELTK